MSPAAEKQALRARLQSWRRTLGRAEVERRSALLAAGLADWLPLQGVRVLLAFVPLAREPHLEGFVAVARARGARLALPHVVGADLEVREALPEGGGLGAVLPPEAVEAALVPGIAFDLQGGRLGRGGGHYDRLLGRLSRRCLRVGVCFAEQVVPRVPREAWDAPVDAVATEQGVRVVAAEVGAGGSAQARAGDAV